MKVDFHLIETNLLPVNRSRLIPQIAASTIKNVYDAIVEIVTNSDDSYLKLEQSNNFVSGRVDINVERDALGVCKELVIVDQAAGMDFDTLKRAIEFSGETSGFKQGSSVRGFFGRGLKEAIIALGRGEIISLKDGLLNRVEIFYNEEKKDVDYNLYAPIANLTNENLIELGIEAPSGTSVRISISNEKKNRIPGSNTFPQQLTKHFALRDILSSKKRLIYLHFREKDRKGENITYSQQLVYALPTGNVVFDEDIPLREVKDVVHFRIFESTEQLNTPRIFFGEAGLIIKTEAACLENQLFGFETDPNGLFFFGEIICPGIAKAIRSGDTSVVDFNRGGLDWKHTYGQVLEKIGKQILSDLISNREERLKENQRVEIDRPVEDMLNKLCNALNDFAKDELEEQLPLPGEIQSFIIRPLVANIPEGTQRSFSVYIPTYIANEERASVVKCESSNNNVQILNTEITIQKHKRYENVLTASFKTYGCIEGETATITSSLGSLTAVAEVRVGPIKKGKKRKNLLAGGSGLIRKITPALDENPIQRFGFKPGGILEIYVRFPGIDTHLGDDLNGTYTPEGKMLLGEILIEAFCRYVARKRGNVNVADVDQFMSELDRLRNKCSRKIYDIIFHSNLKEILDSTVS